MRSVTRLLSTSALLALATFLCQCSDAGLVDDGEPEVQAAPPTSLAEARERWRTTQPSSYVLGRAMVCFCAPRKDSTITTVVDGAITSSVDMNGVPVGDDRPYRTVEALFAFVEDVAAKEGHSLTVQYDARFGYPRTIQADPYPQMADDEVFIQATLEPAP